jgi:hypothetical protein
MPLIYGSYLAGSLLTTLVPIALLICFAVFFYRQAHRQKTVADTKPAAQTTPEPPANPGQPYSHE